MHRVVACAAVALVLGATSAGAQDTAAMERGQRLFRHADFTGAEEAFETALRGELTDEERAVALAHLAAVAIVLDEPGEARARALQAVAHDPAVHSPEGAPRALGPLLREGRERLAALDLELEVEPVEDHRARLELVLFGSRGGLIERLALTCRPEAGGVVRERGAPPRLTLDVEPRPMRCVGRGEGPSDVALVELERSLFSDAGSVAGGAPGDAGPAPSGGEPSSGDTGPSPVVLGLTGAGLAAAVAAAIVVGVLVARGGSSRASFDETRVLGW